MRGSHSSSGADRRAIGNPQKIAFGKPVLPIFAFKIPREYRAFLCLVITTAAGGAEEALALLDGSGSLLDAARTDVRETQRLKALAHVPSVSEAINAYLTAKRAEEVKGEISRLTLYEIESKMRIVRAELGTKKLSQIDEAAVAEFIRKLHHAARGKANQDANRPAGVAVFGLG